MSNSAVSDKRSNMKKGLLLIVFIWSISLPSFVFAGATEEREWTNTKGQKLKATLMKCDSTHVELAMRSKMHTIAISDLSEADQSVLKDLRKRAEGLRKRYFGNRNQIQPEDVKIAWIFGRKAEMEQYMSAHCKTEWYRKIRGTVVRIERRISEQETAIVFKCGLICVAKDKDISKGYHKLITEGKKLYSQRNDARGSGKKCIAEEEELCMVRGNSLGAGSFGLMKGIVVSRCTKLGKN